MNKRVYTAFSVWLYIKFLVLRLGAIVAMIFALSSFNENPIVISIFSIICLFALLFLGDDQVIVYENKVVLSTNSFASFLFKSKGAAYKIEDIKSAYLQPASNDIAEAVAISIFSALLPKSGNSDNTKPIFIELKNGKTVRLETYLDYSKMKKIVDKINDLVK